MPPDASAKRMKHMGIQGIIRGKPHRATVPEKKVSCPLDKVNRQFRVPAPNVPEGCSVVAPLVRA